METDDEAFVTMATLLRDETHPDYVDLEAVHCEQFSLFLQQAINVVSQEIDEGGANGDKIGQEIKKQEYQENNIVCQTCGHANPTQKRICGNCKEKEGLTLAKRAKKAKGPSQSYQKEKMWLVDLLDKKKKESQTKSDENITSDDRYSHVPSGHEKGRRLKLTDPIFVNPNSAETIAEVLRCIGKRLGMKKCGGTNCWTFLCCDGLPYGIISKLQREAVTCTKCSKNFNNHEQFEAHHNREHAGLPHECEPEFDWFYLRIGGGHYEANLLKSFFDLNWDFSLQSMCVGSGFESENAQNFARKCKDHHISWLLLLVFHTGKSFSLSFADSRRLTY